MRWLLSKEKGGSQTATPFIFCLFGAFAFASSIGLTSFVDRLAYLLPIYGFAIFCALASLKSLRDLQAFDWVVVVWLLTILLNPFWSIWTAPSWWFSIVIALLPLGLLAGSNTSFSERMWFRLETLIYAVATFVAIWITAEFIHNEGRRSDGPFLDQNLAGAVMYLVLLPILGRYLSGGAIRNKAQLLRLVVIFLLSFALFATASRGAIGVTALAASVLVGAVLFGGSHLKHRGQTLAATMVVVAGALALSMVVSDALASRNIVDLGNDASTSARLLIWQSTLQMYQEHPWLGSGLGSFALLYPSYRSPAEIGSTGDLAHNDYLQFLAEGGPLLLAGLLVFAGWNILTLFRLLYSLRTRAYQEHWHLLALALAVSAALAHALVNFIFYAAPATVLIALWTARIRSITTKQKAPTQGLSIRNKRNHAAPRMVLLGGVVGAVLLSTNIYSATRFAPAALEAADYTTDSPRFREALFISRFVPFDYLSTLYLIRSETNAALDWGTSEPGQIWAQAALDDIESLRKTKQRDCVADEIQAALYSIYGDTLAAATPSLSPLELLDRATDENPLCRSLYTTAGMIALNTGEIEPGIAVVSKFLPWLGVGVKDIQPTLDTLEILAELYVENGQDARAKHFATIVLENDPTRDRAKAVVNNGHERLP